MKVLQFIILLLCLTACTPSIPQEQVEVEVVPVITISKHYSETLRGDSETMRRAMEIQSVISKEPGARGSDS